MKKYIYIILLTFFVITLPSYGQGIVLQKGNTIHKEIKLTFNDEAIKGNEYLVFEINDDFDFNNIVLLINGQETKEKAFKIYATNENVTVSIDFYLKENATSGRYSFSANLKETSTKLKSNIEYKGGQEFKPVVYVLPKPQWINILLYGLIGLVLLSILFFLYKKSITFSRGTIHITEPKSQNFKLKGLTKFDSKKEGCFLETGICFVLKKGKNGHPEIISKSKDTVLYINNKIEPTGKIINRNYTVKLVKGEIELIFKYI